MNDETTTNETNAELDELRQQNEELRIAARLRDARDQMKAELEKAGARSPDLLFESMQSALDFDAEGKTVNVAELVRGLRMRFPEQFVRDTPTPSVNAGSGAVGSRVALTKEALARMSPAEIAKLDWNAVREALANG